MAYVRSFEGFAPPGRADADPFTKALIQESAEREGEYTTLETITLSPVDTDPSEPLERDLTTDAATLAAAWYRIVWEDASGDTFTGTPIYFPALPSWAPTVSDVAAHIWARTKVKGGKQIGTFNSNTRPTGTEVERLIYQGTRRVATAIGADPCTEELRFDAGAAAAIYTAMLIEQSYWPEQTRNEGSSFRALESLWKDQIKTLTEAVGEQCGGGDGEAVGGSGPLAVGHFDSRRIVGPCYPVW